MNDALKKFFELVAKYRVPPKERTLFSLGGRGYYENAASDMLAFFLRPDAEHGFGTLFLSAFFDSMGASGSAIPELTGATIEREIKTVRGNRIDLQALGGDWCLIIENKIWHILNNPLEDYEDHAKALRTRTHFAVLSPEEGTRLRNGWSGVSYARFCANLRRRLGKALFDAPHSKWHLFAREFILHLENELYNPTMTDEQAIFVEQHVEQIEIVKKLESDYRVFLQNDLKNALEKDIPAHSFSLKDERWAIRCYCTQWGKSNLAFWRENRKFMVTAYLVGLTEQQRSEAHAFFRGMKHWTEGAWMAWYPQAGFASRAKGIEELCRSGKFLTCLFQTPPEPVFPQVEFIQTTGAKS